MAHSKKITAHGGVVDGKSIYYVEIIADTAADIPDPAEHPEWEIGSTLIVLEGGGAKYMLSNARTWVEVPNFTGAGSSPASVEQNVEWAEGVTEFKFEDDDGNSIVKNLVKSVVIPDGIETIGGSTSFVGSTTLERVTLPNNVDISAGAFCQCTALLEVCASGYEGAVWDGEEHTCGSSIASCTKLKKARVPYGTTVLDGSFGGDMALETVELPPTLKRIINGAFGGCAALEQLNIPASVEEIMDGTFGGAGTAADNFTITVHKPEGSISGAPWGATNATVNWLG